MELIDREPLLKILELETKGFRHTETQYNMGYLEAKKQLMEDIREMPTVELEPKWISVKDQLPDEKGYYLVYCPSNSRVYYRYFYVDGYDEEYCLRWGITHWVPLPEPPKEAEP